VVSDHARAKKVAAFMDWPRSRPAVKPFSPWAYLVFSGLNIGHITAIIRPWISEAIAVRPQPRTGQIHAHLRRQARGSTLIAVTGRGAPFMSSATIAMDL